MKPQITLQPRYYLDHFDEMVAFVREKYEHAFEESHRKFLEDFSELSIDARCLYVRFANRKGRVFFRDYLRYEEIENIDSAAEELKSRAFVRTADNSDFNDLLALQTRPTLVELIRNKPPGTQFERLSSAKKKDLVDFAKTNLPFEACFPEDSLAAFLVQERIDELSYLQFLYFGKLHDGMTNFALRDLGVVKPAEFRSTFEARFETREVALVSYHYAKTLITLRNIEPQLLSSLQDEVQSWPLPCDAETTGLRARALRQLGRAIERDGDPEGALSIYQLTDEFPATERTIRILFQLDRREEAKTALEKMIEDPSCDEELLFAEDFYARKFQSKKVGRLTSMLREAPVLTLDESGRGEPEAAAVRHFAKLGVEAAHTENIVWQQLFGLLFWDLLFGEANAPLHSSFDFRPRGLSSGAFAEKNQESIESQLSLLDDPEQAAEFLQRIWDRHEGTPNGLIPWSEDIFTFVIELVQQSPAGALREILFDMAQRHRASRSGFPDLMILEEEGLRFAEIKAEGDKLQRNQLAQLERLRRLGYAVEVIRVEWTVDPEQEYVVVDVETTGGNPQWNRVTEIGAVKVKGGAIVDEWSTLINPGRPVPKKIVELTGITDEMVRDAPRFEQIADEFSEFLGDAVFVAHRAKFDFGFLKSEFERSDREFRCPTLCTVVAMRRYFPGLPSYGLAKLCEEFSVPLESHHRALCDARATAHLLMKINEKRVSESRDD